MRPPAACCRLHSAGRVDLDFALGWTACLAANQVVATKLAWAVAPVLVRSFDCSSPAEGSRNRDPGRPQVRHNDGTAEAYGSVVRRDLSRILVSPVLPYYHHSNVHDVSPSRPSSRSTRPTPDRSRRQAASRGNLTTRPGHEFRLRWRSRMCLSGPRKHGYPLSIMTAVPRRPDSRTAFGKLSPSSLPRLGPGRRQSAPPISGRSRSSKPNARRCPPLSPQS